VRLAWSSSAALAMAPLQDLLNLGKEGRMNVPGRADGNWSWRVTEDMLSSIPFQWLRDITERAKRSTECGIPNVNKAALTAIQMEFGARVAD
jgi:4-alpha-glucanotransferase